MKYLVAIEPSGTGFSAYSPDLPGCASVGATRGECEANMREAIAFHIDGLRAKGEPVPSAGTSAAFVDVAMAQLPTGAATGTAPDDTLQFSNVTEAVATAAYVEQILNAEHQWITNRLSWLFVSQSFCLTAFVILTTTKDERFPKEKYITVLKYGVPILGIVFCAVVGIAIQAAASEGRRLANMRARLCKYINSKLQSNIPLIGVDPPLRDRRWTHVCGGLPQLLPWVLLIFWAALLFCSIHW